MTAIIHTFVYCISKGYLPRTSNLIVELKGSNEMLKL